ncbi:MAG: META domain-containing protein [Thiolinea sp.]
MKSSSKRTASLLVSRRQFLLLPLAVLGSRVLAQEAPATPSIPIPSDACPLNSGGPSLLGTRWRLFSIYGNRVPSELKITMKVEQTSMVGMGGCNNYTANFEQVGNRGFKVTKINQTRKACEVIRPAPGAPTINVGNWEGSYLRVLGRAGSVQQLGATLQFFDFNGAPSVIFAKQYGTG